jgi:hypothetical protein
MLSKKVLDDYSTLYDITKESDEDYPLWVYLLSFGKLYNLSEVLMLYRLYTGQENRREKKD